MLTLQIIRIMNKIWIQEGLDMRMVIFRCFSTGRSRGVCLWDEVWFYSSVHMYALVFSLNRMLHNESSSARLCLNSLWGLSKCYSLILGMVEMIPNAETLRKIQVEHGVTGSFKDRPLADWLQKHNPTEDEYEKVSSRSFHPCINLQLQHSKGSNTYARHCKSSVSWLSFLGTFILPPGCQDREEFWYMSSLYLESCVSGSKATSCRAECDQCKWSNERCKSLKHIWYKYDAHFLQPKIYCTHSVNAYRQDRFSQHGYRAVSHPYTEMLNRFTVLLLNLQNKFHFHLNYFMYKCSGPAQIHQCSVRLYTNDTVSSFFYRP